MSAPAEVTLWSEVFKYFEVSFVDDSPDDIRLKRHVLRSMALTCPGLAELALDELWKSMTTLEPIIGVLNASSLSTNVAFKYHSDRWEFDSTAIRARIPRAQRYLARIHYLHLTSFPTAKEYTLWQTLLNLGQAPTLCPNLQRLYLTLGMRSHNLTHTFFPLICPAVRNVCFTNTVQDKTDEAAASLLLDTLCHHNAELLDISYQGSTSSAIFTRIAQFPTLRLVEVRPINPQSYPMDSSGGALPALRGLQHLTTVDIDFRMFPSAPQVCRWLAGLGTLSTLRLCGSWEDIRGIFDRLTFRIVCRLSLVFEFISKPKSSDNRIDTDFFFQISSSFPRIQSLSLNIKNHQKHAWNSAVTFQDITELRRKAMENIDLQQIPITLSIQELKDVITLWPMLTHLSIAPEDQSLAFDALSILSHIYSHGLRLQALNLPLNFSSLNDPLPLAFACPSKCPLRRLELLRPQNLPKTFQGKHVLARNLVRLFPRLAIVALSPSDGSSGYVQDIQVIIQAFHDLLSIPPRLDIQCIAPTQTTIMPYDLLVERTSRASWFFQVR